MLKIVLPNLLRNPAYNKHGKQSFLHNRKPPRDIRIHLPSKFTEEETMMELYAKTETVRARRD